MQPVKAIQVSGATRLELNPGGYHIMLIDLTAPLQEGEKIPMTLEFKRSGKMDVNFPVMMMYGGDQNEHQHHH
jgi:copper(I)-binding protein